jgi:GntR family transcriptional regulator, hexuronate regulon transcriptional repressor
VTQLSDLSSDTGAKPAAKMSHRLAQTLVESIEGGTYRRGEKLPTERNLCVQYAVSRPTVREALIMLEAQGMVETRHGQGILVVRDRRPNALNASADLGLLELIEACRLFGAEAAALSAATIQPAQARALAGLQRTLAGERLGDPDLCRHFHLEVARVCGNGAIIATIENLWDAIFSAPIPYGQLRAGLARLGQGLAPLYARLVERLAAQDSAGARAAMRDLLGAQIEHLILDEEEDAIARVRSVQEARRREFKRRARA